MHKPLAFALVVTAAFGCAPEVVTQGVAPADAPAADRTPADASPDGASDASIDGATQPDADPTDVLFPGDATPPDDAPVGRDAVTPPDAPPSLRGTWRAVRYEFRDPSTSMMVTLTDRDSPYTDPTSGTATPFRVNGMMYLEPTLFALTFGTLGSEHFYTYAPTSLSDPGYTATGFTVPGILDDGRSEFQITGQPTATSLRRNADGSISFVDSGSGARTTYARAADAGPALPSINVAGLAMSRELVGPGTMTARVALLWDLAGNNRWFESNGSVARFVGRFASYPVTLAGSPPAEAVVAWMGSQVAVARIVVYVDANANLQYDPMGDRVLGVSPVAITWRAAAPFTAAGHFPLRFVGEGWRYGHAHEDFSLGRFDVVPYDSTVPVSPDVPVSVSGALGLSEIL